MKKPSDIPEEVWEEAWKLQGNTTYDEAVFEGRDSAALLQACEDDAEAIARAILAAEKRGAEKEREAAGVVADKRAAMANQVSYPAAIALLQALPDAIRNRTP